jgi:hypothetical protein
MEVYQDVKEIEQNLQKSINIASKSIIILTSRFHDSKEEFAFPRTRRDLGGTRVFGNRKADH